MKTFGELVIGDRFRLFGKSDIRKKMDSNHYIFEASVNKLKHFLPANTCVATDIKTAEMLNNWERDSLIQIDEALAEIQQQLDDAEDAQLQKDLTTIFDGRDMSKALIIIKPYLDRLRKK